MNTSAAVLRETRIYLGFSADGVAAGAGIGEDDLLRIEQGERAASELELRRLSRLYGYPASFLRGEGEAVGEEAVAFLARWTEDLAAEDRDEAARFARYLSFASLADS